MIKGLVVYTTYMLNKANKLSIEKLKKKPKEAMVFFSEVTEVSTSNMPNNWIKLKTTEGKIFYEDKSIVSFIRIVEENTNIVFQKIGKKIAININLATHKSNLSIIELKNGDIYEVNKRYRGKLKIALSRVWKE